MKNKMTTKLMMYIVMFSAVAVIVGMFELPISYIGVKFDLSEVIILSAYLVLGFKNASFVIILRSVVRFILPSFSGTQTAYDPVWKLLGEFIAIIASFTLMYSLIIVKKITNNKQKALIKETPVYDKQSKLTFVLLPIVSALLLFSVMTLFHTVITMPMSLSGYSHLTIFSFLKDPNYNYDLFKDIIIPIVTLFGLLNVVKAVISSLIYLLLKPRLEKMIIMNG